MEALDPHTSVHVNAVHEDPHLNEGARHLNDVKQLASEDRLSHREPCRATTSTSSSFGRHAEGLQEKATIASLESNGLRTLETARALYDLGLNVLPLQYGRKKPLGRWGYFKRLRLEREPLLRFLERFPRHNLGLVTGRTSGNLLVIDCDSRELFDQVGAILSRYRIRPWITQSASGGHFMMRCAEGEVTNYAREDIQLKGNRGYAVIPPSIHPSGAMYRWVSLGGGDIPPVEFSIISEVLGHLGIQVSLRSDRSGSQTRHYPLTDLAFTILAEGDTLDYASHSEAEFAAVVSLVNSGVTDEQIIELFEQYCPPHYASKGSRRQQWLQRYMVDRVDTVRRNGATGTNPQMVQAALRWAAQTAWPGRTGPTDAKAYVACCNRALRMHGVEFRATVREMAEDLAVTEKTAGRALWRLENRHRLLSLAGSNAYGSHTYRLRLDEIPDLTTQNMDACQIRLPSHDAFFTGGLTPASWQIHISLANNPENNGFGFTVSQVQRNTGRGWSTCKSSLEQLQHFGLALEQGNRWFVLPMTDEKLDAIAGDCGTTGTLEKMRQRHQIERQQWATDRYLGWRWRQLMRRRIPEGHGALRTAA